MNKDEYSDPEKDKCDKSTDIYSLGCIFYELTHLVPYQKIDYVREGNFFESKIFKKELSKDIDSNIFEIISDMIEKKQKTEIIYKKIEDNYNKICIKNSGLYSVIRCLTNLPELNEHFLKDYKNSISSENKKYSQKLLFFIENVHKDN